MPKHPYRQAVSRTYLAAVTVPYLILKLIGAAFVWAADRMERKRWALYAWAHPELYGKTRRHDAD